MASARDVVPTRSALLELRQERAFVADGREFLDQKQLLLASEALRELAQLERERAELDRLGRAARTALMRAVERHGLDELSLRAVAKTEHRLKRHERRFLGLWLETAELTFARQPEPVHVMPSPEAARCREAFDALLRCSVRIAALEVTLERLLREYRRTHRRVRALENVLLPELASTIAQLDEQLDAHDREDTLRAQRSAAAGRSG